MAERKQCEFQLIRYVPDPVKNEFVNIGVLLRAEGGTRACCGLPGTGAGYGVSIPTQTRRCWKPWRSRSGNGCGANQPTTQSRSWPCWKSRFPMVYRLRESKAYLAESFLAGLEDLMRRYVDTPPRATNPAAQRPLCAARGHAHAL